MPADKRPNIRDRMQSEARGRAAFTAPVTPAAPPPRDTGEHWEDANQRVTFYCPKTLLAEIEREMRRSGRRKTAVIVDALREHLAK